MLMYFADCWNCTINMETNYHWYIFSRLGKTKNFIKPETKWYNGYTKANCKHMEKLFCSKRMGWNTDEKEN